MPCDPPVIKTIRPRSLRSISKFSPGDAGNTEESIAHASGVAIYNTGYARSKLLAV
jgi:hypothetical protein